jgi:hypothetical protein
MVLFSCEGNHSIFPSENGRDSGLVFMNDGDGDSSIQCKSLVQHVIDRLEVEIISGSLTPGQKLLETELAGPGASVAPPCAKPSAF